MNEKAKKPDKTPGPASYQTQKAYQKTSLWKKPINTTSLSGLPLTQGCNVGTSDKMKIKCNRFLDVVTKNSKKTPGPGSYANLEKGLDKRSRPITSLKIRRH